MKSMTGYGAGKAQSKEVLIEVSLRSVNGRFLETRFHLPREFIAHEGELKKMINTKLQRGTVDVFISRKVRPGQSASDIILNKDLAKKYLRAYKALSQDLHLSYQVHLESLARLPDIMKVEESSEISNQEIKLLKAAFQKAVTNCEKERLREGQFLKKDMEKLLINLKKHIQTIMALREEANKQLQDKFEQKIRTRLKGGEIDPQRLSQEIVIQLEKADINEEITRLTEHIKNYHQLLTSSKAEGKKLDFYTQELLREVNTIGSKSQVAKITQAVVEAKTIIERLREQVQNVE